MRAPPRGVWGHGLPGKFWISRPCEDGAWSVHAVNATPAATSFETPLFTSCSSCVSPTEIKESDEEHHCVGKN